MKAAVYHGRRDIRIESVPDPPNPGPGEVVLEVARAAICGTDSSEWAHGPMLTRPPVTLGHEFVGRVVSIGDEVTGLSKGDRVVSGVLTSWARPPFSCNPSVRYVEQRFVRPARHQSQ